MIRCLKDLGGVMETLTKLGGALKRLGGHSWLRPHDWVVNDERPYWNWMLNDGGAGLNSDAEIKVRSSRNFSTSQSVRHLHLPNWRGISVVCFSNCLVSRQKKVLHVSAFIRQFNPDWYCNKMLRKSGLRANEQFIIHLRQFRTGMQTQILSIPSDWSFPTPHYLDWRLSHYSDCRSSHYWIDVQWRR